MGLHTLSTKKNSATTERTQRVHRLFVDAPIGPRSTVQLSAPAAHHAARVLRLADGDAVVLFDGRGGEYEARLVIAGRSQVSAETGERRDPERESPLRVTLVQAISSSDKMDLTIQKAAELGIAAIQPVFSARSLVRLSGEREAKKLAHWRRIVIAACEQCGRNRLPEVREAMSVEACSRLPPAEELRLLLSPEGAATLKDIRPQPGQAISLAVGPEAGFSDEEEQALRRAGYGPLRLGPRVLRTETAALAALAALNALAGDF